MVIRSGKAWLADRSTRSQTFYFWRMEAETLESLICAEKYYDVICVLYLKWPSYNKFHEYPCYSSLFYHLQGLNNIL